MNRRIAQRERGFGLIVVFIVVLLVGLVVAGLYMAGTGFLRPRVKYIDDSGANLPWKQAKMKNAQNSATSGAVMSPTPGAADAYRGWLTYKSAEGTFSLRYPPTMRAVVIMPNGRIITAVTLAYTDAQMEFPESVYVSVADNSAGLSVEDYVQKYIYEGSRVTYTNVSVAGIPAKQTSDLPSYSQNIQIFFQHRQYLYTIEWEQGNGPAISQQLFQQILSSFQLN